MTISFDLDDTLIPSVKRFDTESRSFLHKAFKTEKIRKGTTYLMKRLQTDGHRIFIYTTSYRSAWKIWWMFFLQGIRIDKIINQTIHEKILKERAKNYSKYPPAFGIDVHVDDSAGVEMEGNANHFQTIIITENTTDWTASVLSRIAFLSQPQAR